MAGFASQPGPIRRQFVKWDATLYERYHPLVEISALETVTPPANARIARLGTV